MGGVGYKGGRGGGNEGERKVCVGGRAGSVGRDKLPSTLPAVWSEGLLGTSLVI